MKCMVPKTVGACFALIERKMLKGPWVMGETYTICDPYLYTIALWLEGDGVDLASLPKVADHRKRMFAERHVGPRYDGFAMCLAVGPISAPASGAVTS